MNPGSSWVELAHVDFCSVNAYLPGLNPGKQPTYGGGLSLPGVQPGWVCVYTTKPRRVYSTQGEPGFTLGSSFYSVNRALQSNWQLSHFQVIVCYAQCYVIMFPILKTERK